MAAVAACAVAASACNKPHALGPDDTLIVMADSELWQLVEDTTRSVLEPTVFTTRPEKRFVVTATSGDDPEFSRLRVFKNIIVFGTPEDTLLAKAAGAAGLNLDGLQPGRVFEAEDVWARNQRVTGAVLQAGGEAESWAGALPAILSVVDGAYRERTRRQMFATPPDTSLVVELRERFGFGVVVPVLYDRVVRAVGEVGDLPGAAGGDSLVILRNDNPDPSELIRSLLITWGPPLAEGEVLTVERAIEWRATIDSAHYNVPQALDTSTSSVTHFLLGESPGLEVTGVWRDELTDYPAAGPFFVWMVGCPERTFYIDAWLYSPDRPKYQYILQLQEILRSFHCA